MATTSRRSLPSSRGFTLVEMLVVIAVIAALIGLLLAGLQAAQRSSKRTKQLSDLRQVFNGWIQYASTYGDALMPGYMDDEVQTAWRVSYKAKDGSKIPQEYTRTYPWRLMPYLDHSFSTLFEYLELDDIDSLHARDPSGNPNPAGLATVSSQPAFGYNANYLGGWWTMEAGAPTLRFGNSTWTDASGSLVTGRVVATKLASVAVPDSMIAFAASSFREPGFYKMESDDRALGAAWVVPHLLAGETIWLPSDGTSFGSMQLSDAASLGTLDRVLASAADLFGVAPAPRPTLAQSAMLTAGNAGVEVLVAQAVPQRRFGSSVATVQVDGSTGPLGLGELVDQRRWMNPAISGQGAASSFTHSPN